MRKLLFLTFTILAINSLPAQTSSIESKLYNCFTEKLLDIGIEIDSFIYDMEEQLIKDQLFKDHSGKSYKRFLKRIELGKIKMSDFSESFFLLLTNSKLINRYGQGCSGEIDVFKDESFNDSKLSEILETGKKLEKPENPDLAFYVIPLTKNLSKSDYEKEPFYRFIILSSLQETYLEDNSQNDENYNPIIDGHKFEILCNDSTFTYKEMNYPIDSLEDKISQLLLIENLAKDNKGLTTPIEINYLIACHSEHLSTQTKEHLHNAFQKARNTYSISHFNKSFKDLTHQEQMNIRKIFPFTVARIYITR